MILLGFWLRLQNLTYHSLWFDEAVSVYWSKQTVARILEVGFTLQEDRLPPLYYLLLKGWTNFFGLSEFGVRSLSVLLGALLIPVMMNLAQRLFNNRRIALLTGLLIALNPFLIWYSQEARMYAPAVLFGALAVRASLSAMHRFNTSASPLYHLLPSTVYLIFAILALYSHLYAGFLLPAIGIWLMVCYPKRWSLWLWFGLTGLLITLAYLPILYAIWQFSGEATPGDPFSGVGGRAWWLLDGFLIWQAPLSDGWRIAIIGLTLGLVGAAYLPNADRHPLVRSPKTRVRDRSATALAVAQEEQQLKQLHSSDVEINSHPPRPLLLTTLLLLMPFVIAHGLLFRNYLAFFGERYFIVMLPWLLLLTAVGMVKVGNFLQKNLQQLRLPSATATAVALLITLLPPTIYLIPLPGQWSIEASKEAWRQSVAYLADHAEAHHGILIHPDWVRHPFQFYFRGPGQTYAAFSQVSPTTSLDGPLQGVVSDHEVIWLIQSHTDGADPERLVEQWFGARYPLVTELYPPGITLKGYAPGYQLDSLPETATPLEIRFANDLHLVGYQADTHTPATDTLFHPPSAWVHVTLYWSIAQPLGEDVQPYVHLVGPEGVWGINLDRPTDALDLYPTSRWQTGQLIRHDVDVNLNPATPPGTYQLVVGLHGHEGEVYPLGQVVVE